MLLADQNHRNDYDEWLPRRLAGSLVGRLLIHLCHEAPTVGHGAPTVGHGAPTATLRQENQQGMPGLLWQPAPPTEHGIILSFSSGCKP